MSADAVLMALVMALSPLAVLASVLLLTTERGVRKAGAYAVGWLVAVGAVGALTVYAESRLPGSSGGGTSTTSAVIDLVLGAVLVLWSFRRRVAANADASGPGWVRRLDDMSPLVAAGFGLFMPPYAIAVAAVNSILQADGSGGGADVVVPVAVFTVLASLGVIVPVVLAVSSSASEAILARWRTWLLGHSNEVLFWMLLVIGAYLAAKGAYGLLG